MLLNCSTTAEADVIVCSGTHYVEREVLGPTSPLFWTYLVLYAVLVLAAGKPSHRIRVGNSIVKILL